jgi:hypothetical protein
LNGAHGDLNETFLVGQVDASSKKLVKVRTQPFCGWGAVTWLEHLPGGKCAADIVSWHFA